jgi:hypothetical protein
MIGLCTVSDAGVRRSHTCKSNVQPRASRILSVQQTLGESLSVRVRQLARNTHVHFDFTIYGIRT